jgi:hypothetical protein
MRHNGGRNKRKSICPFIYCSEIFCCGFFNPENITKKFILGPVKKLYLFFYIPSSFHSLLFFFLRIFSQKKEAHLVVAMFCVASYTSIERDILDIICNKSRSRKLSLSAKLKLSNNEFEGSSSISSPIVPRSFVYPW